MSILLKMRTDKCSLPEVGEYTSHGVDVYDKKTNAYIKTIKDITLSVEKMKIFVDACNALDVQYVNLDDLIEILLL